MPEGAPFGGHHGGAGAAAGGGHPGLLRSCQLVGGDRRGGGRLGGIIFVFIDDGRGWGGGQGKRGGVGVV